ncbi:MAG: phage tail spike protein [Christensenellaceae bacterium]
MIRPFEPSEQSPEKLFTKFIDEHNAQVNDYQKFTVGNVTVTDANDYIYRYSEKYITAWEAIKTRLLTPLGGFLVIRYENGNRYLDYLEDYPYTSTQIVQYAENMQSILLKQSASETYTRVIPLGARIEGESAESRLTIESVAGVDYIANEALEALYGVIVAPVDKTTWDDITLPQNLYQAGLNYLNTTATTLKETVSVTAVDLHNVDSSIAPLKFGEYIRVVSSLHNMNKSYIAKRAITPLNNPANARITLGDTSMTLTGSRLEVERENVVRFENIEKNYASNDAVSTTIAETKESLSSLIAQSAEEILLTVNGEYTTKEGMEEALASITTSLQILQNEVRIDFENVTQIINNMDGETSAQFEEITKYIRFLDGNMLFGASDSNIKLCLNNNEFFFFTGADETADKSTAWAYMDSGQLYIRDAEIINTLILGNFAWSPESNGSLSLMKVRG